MSLGRRGEENLLLILERGTKVRSGVSLAGAQETLERTANIAAPTTALIAWRLCSLCVGAGIEGIALRFAFCFPLSRLLGVNWCGLRVLPLALRRGAWTRRWLLQFKLGDEARTMIGEQSAPAHVRPTRDSLFNICFPVL